MGKLLLIAVLLSLILSFGCIALQEGASKPAAGKSTTPAGTPKQSGPAETPAQAPSGAPKTTPQPTPPENPVPVPDATQIVAPKPEPIAAFAILSPGDRLDFGDGSITLEDVWSYSPVLPAIITMRNQSGAKVWQKQAIPGLEAPYTSPSGRRFWIYPASTDAASDIYFKRAAIYVLEAREKGESFDRSLYSGILPPEKSAAINQSAEFSGLAIGGLLNKSQNLSASGFVIKFEGLRLYPEEKTTAMASIYDSKGKLVGFSGIPLKHAYVFAMPDTSRYAIYNRASGEGRNGTELADLRVYNAGNLQAGRLYRVVGFETNKSGKKLGEFAVGWDPVEVEGRGFSARLSDFSTPSLGEEFAALEAIDEDGFRMAYGAVRKDVPLQVTDFYGRKYEIWLQSLDLSGVYAKASVYRIS